MIDLQQALIDMISLRISISNIIAPVHKDYDHLELGTK